MTRINLIQPSKLYDQHLLAEWREIKMVPASLRRSLKTKSKEDILKSIPKNFTLNTGHVKFFFDKLDYLSHRYESLTTELLKRNFKLYHTGNFSDFCENIPQEFFGDYIPEEKDFLIITNRINEKIAMRPNWYRYCGVVTQNL